MLRSALPLLGLLLITPRAAAATPEVVCQIITPANDGMIESQRVEAIARRAAASIVDHAAFRRVPLSDAADACRASEDIDRCISRVLAANRRAMTADMHASNDVAYLLMSARIAEGGFIEGMAFFSSADGESVAVSYRLEPLDGRQRPRRHVGEKTGRADWFASDSTYLLETQACDVAHRLGLAAEEKHVTVRAFDRENDFDDGTIDWHGAAIVY